MLSTLPCPSLNASLFVAYKTNLVLMLLALTVIQVSGTVPLVLTNSL